MDCVIKKIKKRVRRDPQSRLDARPHVLAPHRKLRMVVVYSRRGYRTLSSLSRQDEAPTTCKEGLGSDARVSNTGRVAASTLVTQPSFPASFPSKLYVDPIPISRSAGWPCRRACESAVSWAVAPGAETSDFGPPVLVETC